MALAFSGGRSAVFEELRRRLFSIAYRMLGTTADAEDVLQDAYLRWHQANVEEVRSPEAWLVSVVTRLSIDRLRKVIVERERYVGPWLPEPLLNAPEPTPEENLEHASDFSLAFMVLLERLAPVERAAFLLHDVFDCAYPAIASILQKSEGACRQLVHRARERVKTERQRFRAGEEDRRKLIQKFIAAANAGDEITLLSLFAEDATLMSDGGGIVPAARKIVHGRARIARLYLVLARKMGERLTQKILYVNGETALITLLDNKPFAVTSFDTDGRLLFDIYTILNPEKLTQLALL